jgi:hypothetical protein
MLITQYLYGSLTKKLVIRELRNGGIGLKRKKKPKDKEYEFPI